MGGSANGSSQVHQVYPLKREQIPLGYHANQAVLFVDHTQMGKMVFRHQHCRLKGVRCGGQATGIACHHLTNGRVEGAFFLSDHGAQVAQRENAGGMAIVIGDNDAAHIILVHPGYGLANRQIR